MRMPATEENLEQFPDHSALPGSPLLKGLPGFNQLDSVLARKVPGRPDTVLCGRVEIAEVTDESGITRSRFQDLGSSPELF